MIEEKPISNQTQIMERLTKAVEYAYNNSPFYKEHLKDSIGNFGSFTLEDYQKLPFTTKQDIADQNEAFLCVPMNKVAEFVTTSGTSGDPITMYLTKADLERLAENERASLSMMDGSSDDIYQLLTTIDKQFMAGLAYYLGVQKMNAGMIRVGPGVVAAQLNAIEQYKPTKLIAVPSFILALIDYAKAKGIDLNNSSVNGIVCIGEPIRDANMNYNTLGKKITDQWGVKLYSTYASTEMATAFSECIAQNGGHVNEELIFVEVLDENDQQVSNGETGEVVVTTLGVEGTPIIRYRTGDIASYWNEPCSCGRTSPRIGTIIGRKNQLIKFKGTSVYPQAIVNVLKSFDEVSIFHIVVDKDVDGIDILSVQLPKETISETLVVDIRDRFKALLKVNPTIDLVSLESIQKRNFDKAKRKPKFITFN